jgi:two-component system OmpR family response regulator
MKILIVEDNHEIAQQLTSHLEESGFITHVANNGEDGLFEGEEGAYDAVLLDVGLPGMDGFSILQQWRKNKKMMPVILLTARNSKMEIVRGLELGADDYITKPFDLEEVVARLKANIRKYKGQFSNIMEYGVVKFDMSTGKVTVNGKLIKLTRIEFLIVQYLFMHQAKTVSVNELIEHVYQEFDNDSGIIPRHIANIRKKIGADIILTDSNRGYYVPKQA